MGTRINAEKDLNRLRNDFLTGLWYRAFAWIKSISMINHICGLQAFATANRALLEFSVDMIFLSNDKTNSNGEKLFWFMQSEKLKVAENLVSYGQINNRPDLVAVWNNFAINNRIIIKEKRKLYWDSGIKFNANVHPNKRWTGSSDLKVDVVEADKVFEALIRKSLGMKLENYYKTEYSRVNWLIHSGTSSFWNLPAESFEAEACLNFIFIASFGVLCSEIILRDFEINKYWENYENEITELNNQRNELINQVPEIPYPKNLI